MTAQTVHPLRIKNQENKLKYRTTIDKSKTSPVSEDMQNSQAKPINFAGVMLCGFVLAIILSFGYIMLYPFSADFITSLASNLLAYSKGVTVRGVIGCVAYLIGAFFFIKGLVGVLKFGQNPEKYQLNNSLFYMLVSTSAMVFPVLHGAISSTLPSTL